MPKINKEDRNQIYLELQNSMKKEIMAMREMLANMHQEELLLLAHDKESMHILFAERAALVSYLGNLRDLRVSFANKLVDEENNEDDEMSQDCETLMLRDQIVALAEKINLQHRQNQHLGNDLAPMWQKEPEKKKKIFLQTEEENRGE